MLSLLNLPVSLLEGLQPLSVAFVERAFAQALHFGLAIRLGPARIGKHAIPLQLSRQQLASYVCARVETTIRVMSAWHKQGLVETHKDGFVIPAIDALREVLREPLGEGPRCTPMLVE